MAAVPVYVTHAYPGNKSSFLSDPGDGRTFAWLIGRDGSRIFVAYSGFTPGNAIQVDDPGRPTWTCRKAFMVPTQSLTYNGAIRVWDFHTYGGGVGYTSGYSFAAVAMDVQAAGTTDSNGTQGAPGTPTVHGNPYFQWALNGATASQYQPALDFYNGNYHKRFFQYEFAFDTWYGIEISAGFFTDGTGFFTAKVNNAAWFDYQNGVLGWAGVSTAYYPNLNGKMGFETLEGAYLAAGSVGNEKEFIIYHTPAQYGTSPAACAADVVTVGFGDHSIAVAGSGQPASFTAATGTTIDDSLFGGASPVAPSNTVPPVTSTSSPILGVSLTTTTGTWTGSPSFTYQWARSSNGTTWVNIGAATASSYTPVSADVGNQLRATVTGTNGSGSGTATTSPTSAVVSAAGGSVVLGHTPASASASIRPLNGDYKTGADFTLDAPATVVDIRMTLTGSGSAGTHAIRAGIANATTGAILCLSNDSTFDTLHSTLDGVFVPTTLPTLPAGTYRPFGHFGVPSAAPMQGYFDSGVGLLKYQADVFADGTTTFTASSGDGLMAIWVNLTAAAPSGASAPVNSGAPAISGSFVVGQTVTCAPGTWSNTPSFTYQWTSATTAGGAYSTISLATQQTYTIPVTQVGNFLKCIVTATNTAGSASATTPATTQILFPAPVASIAPLVTGNQLPGGQLVVSTGTWDNFPTSYAYQWEISVDGIVWGPIANQITAAYTSVAGDIGKLVRASVTATNGTGSTTATSNAARIVPSSSVRIPTLRVQNPSGRRNAPAKRHAGTGGGL